MNIDYVFIKHTLRQKISENLCGSCIGCLLDSEEDHSCELNCLNLISQFDFCFNSEKSARLEVLITAYVIRNRWSDYGRRALRPSLFEATQGEA